MKNTYHSVVRGGRLALVAVAATVTAASSFAAAIDVTAMTGAVDVSTVVTGIVAMGALMILPSVAKWSVKKIATFFG
jgi:hypothetical protein